MYKVTVTPLVGGTLRGASVSIHDGGVKLLSGSVVQGINTINSFTFTLPPTSEVFNALPDYLTLVDVYDTAQRRYEFQGRVLCSYPSMDESGLITREVTCESLLAVLCDSEQTPVEERAWIRRELLACIVSVHNEQVEDYKKITIGGVDNPNDVLSTAIARESSWDSILKLLVEKLGGELQLRVENDKLYLDYLTRIGQSTTPDIALGRNMKAASQEADPSEIITRLIPLGRRRERARIGTAVKATAPTARTISKTPQGSGGTAST